MKRFIFQLSMFSLLVVGIIVLIIVSINSYINKKADFKIQKSSQYIVLGNSHPEYGLNDSLISDFSNFAVSGESYFYTFPKARKLLSQNKNIRVVFIEFDNSCITKKMDKWIWDNNFLARYPEYSPFMDYKDNGLIAANNFSGLLNVLSVSIKTNIDRIINRGLNYSHVVGGYVYVDRCQVDTFLSNPAMLKTTENVENDTAFTNIRYLEKLITYCKEGKKEVFLIRCPIHPKSLSVNNEGNFQETLLSKFPDVEFLDFKTFPLLNSEFADLEHLNFKGQENFLCGLITFLKEGFSQKQINSSL